MQARGPRQTKAAARHIVPMIVAIYHSIYQGMESSCDGSKDETLSAGHLADAVDQRRYDTTT